MSDKQLRLTDYPRLPLPHPLLTGNRCINIRGTNGSGKSYLVREVLKRKGIDLDAMPIFEMEANGEKWPVTDCGSFYLIGRYNVVSGGLDTVKDIPAVAIIVMELIKKKHVLMEGLLWSGVFGASYELTKQLREAGTDMLWLFLDTDAQGCINNVLKRRVAQGDTRPFNTRALIMKYRSCVRIQEAAYRVGAAARTGSVDVLLPSVLNSLLGIGMPSDDFVPLKACDVEEGMVSDHIQTIQDNVASSPLAGFFE